MQPQGDICPVLRLVGDALQVTEGNEQGEYLPEVAFPRLTQGQQVGEDVGKSMLDLVRHALRTLGQVSILLLEGRDCLPKHDAAFLGDELDVPGEGVVGRSTELFLLTTDGHRIIADPFQSDVAAHDRRDQSQMPGAGQVAGDEDVAQVVNPAHVAVDVAVIQYGLVGQGPISGEQSVYRVLHSILNAVPHFPDRGPDRGQVFFQLFFVVHCRVYASGAGPGDDRAWTAT